MKLRSFSTLKKLTAPWWIIRQFTEMKGNIVAQLYLSLSIIAYYASFEWQIQSERDLSGGLFFNSAFFSNVEYNSLSQVVLELEFVGYP